MTSEIVVVTLAGLFSLGCIAIHSLRVHAKKMTEVFALTVLCLAPFTLFVALAIQPPTPQRGGVGATPMPKRTMGQDAEAKPSTAHSFNVARAQNANRQGDLAPTADDITPFSSYLDEPARTALPEQDASPDGTGEMPVSAASKNAERIK